MNHTDLYWSSYVGCELVHFITFYNVSCNLIIYNTHSTITDKLGSANAQKLDIRQ